MKQKIKKTALGILAASMVLSTGTATTFAARTDCGRYYVDANGDGICDNYDSSKHNCRFTDKNKDGICDNCGLASHKKGQNFVDKDGDGICDNRGNGKGNGNRNGRKQGNGCHNGRGRRR